MDRRLLPAVLIALNAAPAPCSPAAGLSPDVEVDRLGEPVIEAANNYSENTTVRIRLVYPAGHPRYGEPLVGYHGPVRVEEWNTQIYDGLDGATRLPLTLRIPRGEARVVLKSLARFAHFDMRNMPVPQIAVDAGGPRRLLQVPQWIDADGNDKTDWLEQRVDDLLARARRSPEPAVARAAAALQSWEQSFKRDCGGFDEHRPGIITIAAACMDWDGVDSHRLNRGLELSATVLHELWHVWRHASSAAATRHRRWPKSPSAPVEPIPCPFGCTGPVWLADPRFAAEEDEAEAFAERYKHLLQ